MKFGAENDAGVLYAVKGRYKGKEVTVTHHDGTMAWIEDYPVGSPPLYGLWVPNDSIQYGIQPDIKEEINQKVNQRNSKRSKKSNKKKTDTIVS